jgi:hypothetical protein
VENKKPASALAEARAYGVRKLSKSAHPQVQRSVQQQAQQAAGVGKSFIAPTIWMIETPVKPGRLCQASPIDRRHCDNEVTAAAANRDLLRSEFDLR